LSRGGDRPAQREELDAVADTGRRRGAPRHHLPVTWRTDRATRDPQRWVSYEQTPDGLIDLR